jgi:hypothetical protein
MVARRVKIVQLAGAMVQQRNSPVFLVHWGNTKMNTKNQVAKIVTGASFHRQ